MIDNINNLYLYQYAVYLWKFFAIIYLHIITLMCSIALIKFMYKVIRDKA